MNKKDIRKNILDIRLKLSEKEVSRISDIFYNDIIHGSLINKYENIYLYSDFKNELQTTKLINYCLKSDKNVYLPKVIDDKKMVFIKVDNNSKYSISNMNIKEPLLKNDYIENYKPGLMIIPLVATDMKYRLGYGKGYYDRFLIKNNMFHTIGVGYKFQLIEKGFNDEFDIALDDVYLY